MPQITFIQPDGTRRSIAAQPGTSIMQTAVANAIPGIIAECGGAAMCCTCHVYLDETSVPFVAPVSEVENEMLEGAASGRRENSRLGCQLILQAGVEELIVHLPSRQV